MKTSGNLVKALAGIVFLSLIVNADNADRQPKQYDDRTTQANCSNYGAACTQKTTPGSWYCGKCLFYDCGCGCTNVKVKVITMTGMCNSWELNIPGYNKTFNSCVNLSPLATNTVVQTLCYKSVY